MGIMTLRRRSPKIVSDKGIHADEPPIYQTATARVARETSYMRAGGAGVVMRQEGYPEGTYRGVDVG